jgi:predicted DCC family thiol-disulfide oxidoreductase YuxK
MSDVHILYNGGCPVCRAEIHHYRDKAVAAGAPLRFEDLNAVDLGSWRVSGDQAARRLHARLPDGQIVSGVEAFALIWDLLPRYRWLATLVRLPIVSGLAGFAYNRIAAPALYRRHKRRMALEAVETRP